MDNRDAYFILNLLPGIGPVRVTQLLTLFGEPKGILAASRSALARVPGIGDHLAGIIHNWKQHCDPSEERALAEKAGVTILSLCDDAYPPLLREIHDPPLCLYVRGSLEALKDLRSAIAIVGSRRTTFYGTQMSETLATAAAMAGWTVVSGLARGIDTAAHRATVRMHGRTIAVLGGGLTRLYPQENVQLARDIVDEGGALISEFPMRCRPDKRTFPMRNRIISGLCQGCIVVEAGHRSGSLITATQALEQNRQVFAVPGRVDSPQAKGCHKLIKDGAKLVESFSDVLEEFTAFPGLFATAHHPSPPKGGARGASPKVSDSDLHLSDLERKLMSFLGDADMAIDDIVVGLEQPTHQVLSAVVKLEMRHLLRQLPGKRVVKCDQTVLA